MEAAALMDFVAPLADAILHRLRSKEVEDLAWDFEVEKDIEKIRILITRVRSAVREAEQKKSASEDKVARIWLKKVRDALYEAADLLDELEELNASNRARSSSSSVAISHQSLFRNSIPGKFEELSKKFQTIEEDKRGVGMPTQKGVRTEFTPKPCSFLGRDHDVEYMLSNLLDKSSEHAQEKLLIVGREGLGKTTLANYVYDNQKVQDHFDLRMWVSVCASLVENSNISDGIIKSVSCREHSKLANLKLAEVNLQETLKGKRFLLVLDDVWHEHSNVWEQFFCNLLVGERGSKLLITTRNSNAAEAIGVMQRYVHDLDPLWSVDSWRLFKEYVDGNRIFVNKKLKSVGWEIVTLLSGVPGAIQTIASLLSQQLDVEFWKEILETCQAQTGGNNDITGLVMAITYQHLPPDVKQCLVYCSLFPRGYKLEKPNIVHAWVAGGFILPHEGRSVDHIANQYFDTLLSMSFFHCFADKYILNDSVHELAPRIVVSSCSRVDWLSEIPISTNHLSLFPDNLWPSELEDLCRFRCLRSLVFLHRNKSTFDRLTEELLPALKSLRVIDLSHTDLKGLPSSVGELTHLRLLNLSYTNIQSLPETLSHLHKLQVLDLVGCHMLFALPAGVNRMTSLRHLKASPYLVSTIDGIGNLASLQSLEEFKVYKREGHRIVELKEMNKLQGGLCIRDLENVSSEKEANEAQLSHKVYLEMLELRWSEDRHADTTNEPLDHGKILEGLRPPPSLKMISIKGYSGSKSPAWMGSGSNFSKLETVSLKNCRRWDILPPLWEAPCLKFLEIYGLKRMRKLSDSRDHEATWFPSLVELRLHGLFEWEEWFGAEGGFPCLRVLEIMDCPRLRILPQLPSALKELRIERVGLTTLQERRDPSDALVWPRPLSSIYISDCDHLQSLDIRSFKSLTLRKCKELKKFPIWRLHNLATVESLIVEDCPKLVDLDAVSLMKASASSEFCNKGFIATMSFCTAYLQETSRTAIHLLVNTLFSHDSVLHLDSWRMHLPEHKIPRKDALLVPTACMLLYINFLHTYPAERTTTFSLLISCMLFLFLLGLMIYVACEPTLHLHSSRMPSPPDHDSRLPSSIRNLEIRGSPGVVRKWLFVNLQARKSLSFVIIKDYPDIASFKKEALHQLTALAEMSICYTNSNLLSSTSADAQCSGAAISLNYASYKASDGDHFASRMDVTIRGQVTQGSIYRSIAQILECIKSLKHLEISGCPDMTSLPGDELVKYLTVLESLTVSSCFSLRSFNVQALAFTLKSLAIKNCPNLTSFTVEQEGKVGGRPFSVQNLVLHGCTSLHVLPSNMRRLEFLEVLRIENCPQLRCLPQKGLPISLRELVIQQSPMLTSRCQRESGLDWHKIAYIPNIYID
ncbi:putative disease resistance protein RGA3 [Typha latifolia]|uniref:putative disease resistance protein RGA3 n=1 Tax=Typha latifolia TaxID=4733 RepID=UPI003C3047DC